MTITISSAFDAGNIRVVESRGDTIDPRVGPRLAPSFAEAGIEPLEVRPFPVSISRLGAPEAAIWRTRRAAVETELAADVFLDEGVDVFEMAGI